MKCTSALLLSLSLGLGVTPAFAQSLPGQYDVAYVASADVLNIRAEPSAKAQVIGEIAPYTTRVEVVKLSDDKKWGLVSAGEISGWASMAYLQASAPGAKGDVPRPLSCRGTEPFWSLKLPLTGGAEWSTPDGGEVALKAVTQEVAGTGYKGSYTADADRRFDLVVTREECSDGMSDRIYGFRARLTTSGADQQSLTGCCTLDAR